MSKSLKSSMIGGGANSLKNDQQMDLDESSDEKAALKVTKRLNPRVGMKEEKKKG